MAAELVGGAFLSSFLSVLFERIASRPVVDFFKARKLHHSLVHKLKIAMNSVGGLLDDAEEQEITRPAVKEWLDQLKHAFFEADDLLDEVFYEATRLQVAENKYPLRCMRKVHGLFSKPGSFKEMQDKLKEIIETFEFLVNQKEVLGLREGIGRRPSSQKLPTTSRVDESSVLGREAEKEAILKLILSEDLNGEAIGVVSIVGMGGVGKTTLAQILYKDKRIQQRFDLKAWISVSEDFDVFKITRDMLDEIGIKDCVNMTPNQLQIQLEQQLAGKKFILFLDDVWNEKHNDWDTLVTPFKAGASGSWVIVTTRNDTVASAVSSSFVLHLDALNDEDCWLLFCKRAFLSQDSNNYPQLSKIGKEIVKKCGGLPLAVKTLGSLLHSKRNVEYWEEVLESNFWDFSKDDVLPVLRLSYHYLPSHLKRCFSYCSLFPKDYGFRKEEVVSLWIAEGFVQSKENKEIEKVGDRYFDELVSRSFFQELSDGSCCFVMHDLMNDLAKVVAGEYCFRFDSKDPHELTSKTRYFSWVVTKQDLPDQLLAITKPRLWRTFITVYRSQFPSQCIAQQLTPGMFQTLERLRLLSLSRFEKLYMLPNSIGCLKHLHYLDLSRTAIRQLPESLCSLYNLETLKLENCFLLDELPTKLANLVNMCHLDIRETRLQEMPPHMGKLFKLRKLTDFLVGKQGGSNLKELGKLLHIGGSLSIRNLRDVKHTRYACDANLKSKKHLKELTLEWKENTNDTMHDNAVLGGLQPHPDVERISIYGYGGMSFPDWLGDWCFTKLVSLELAGCQHCLSLPQLGHMVSLKYLTIREFNELVVIDDEVFGKCSSSSLMKSFQSLEILRFVDMPRWEKWLIPIGNNRVEHGAFPLLQQLDMENCPMLKGGLPAQLPSLRLLYIFGCPLLQASLPRAPNLASMDFVDDSRVMMMGDSKRLKIYKFLKSHESLVETLKEILVEEMQAFCTSLERFPLEMFQKLRSCKIIRCARLESFSIHNTATLVDLKLLQLWDCPSFVSFMGQVLSGPNLTELSLWNCSKLTSLPECMEVLLPSLLKLSVCGCPEMDTFPKGGLPSKLQSLVISDCSKLIAGRMQWDLQKLHPLLQFNIGQYYEEMDSFPDLSLLPSSVTCLCISNVPYVKSLNYKGLQHLVSLKVLFIYCCPALRSVQELELPSSLTSLCIWNLPNMKPLDYKGRQELITFAKELKIQRQNRQMEEHRDCKFEIEVPSSLKEIVPVIQVSNDVESANPRIAFLCRFFAFRGAHWLDPTSSGEGVREFKTALFQYLESHNDSTLTGRTSITDAREMQKFYHHYYQKLSEALQDASDESDWIRLTNAYKNANVFFEILKAVQMTESVGIDTEMLEAEDRVTEMTGVPLVHNIIPLLS